MFCGPGGGSGQSVLGTMSPRVFAWLLVEELTMLLAVLLDTAELLLDDNELLL